jgi:hypothetical protein
MAAPGVRRSVGGHDGHDRGTVLTPEPRERSGPFLDFDPDPAVWLVGPTPERPVEQWIPAATEAQIDFFGLADHQDRERGHVGDILASTARLHPSPLPLFVLRWRELSEVPLALFFGLVDATGEPELAEQWLNAADAATVEPPVVDELDAPDGMSLRRSLVYSLDEAGAVVVGVRYVVSTGNPDGIVLAHAASDAPAEILSAREDIEALLRTVRITDTPPQPV